MWIAILLLSLTTWGVLFVVPLRMGCVPKCAPRRPVPWGMIDVLIIFLLHTATPTLCYDLIQSNELFLWTESEQEVVATEDMENDKSNTSDSEEEARSHSALRVIQGLRSKSGLWIVFFVVIVVAPLLEEFRYRLVLQGAIEKYERLLRHPIPLGRVGSRGLLSISMTAVYFASVHARSPDATFDMADAFQALAAQCVAFPFVMLGSIAFLALRGATLKDFGVQTDHFFQDVRTGVLTFLLIALPLYGVQVSLSELFPDRVVDPFTLFPFAIVLGFLYFRTHRIVPSIVLHMSLNATSVVLLMWVLA
jgi:membrane protease YdiL (CAAX protease family)